MPFEVFEPDFSRLKLIVAGMPGAGKTRWTRSWPWPLYLDVEGRMLSVRKDRPRTWKVNTSKDLDEFVRVIKQDRDILERKFHGPVETINVDTLDEVCRMFIQERKASTGHDMQRDDWGWLKDRVGDFVRAMRNLDMHVLFSVHLTQNVISDDPKRVEYWPQVSGAMQSEMFNFVDIAVLMKAQARHDPNGERLERELITFPNPEHPWIKEHTGDIPNRFKVNFEDDWSRLAKAIWGAVPDPAKPLSEDALEKAAEQRTEFEEMQADLERQAEEKAAAELRKKAAEAQAVDDDVAALRTGTKATKSTKKAAPAKVDNDETKSRRRSKPKNEPKDEQTDEVPSSAPPAAEAPADETPPAENESSAPDGPGEAESQPEPTPEDPPPAEDTEVGSEPREAAEAPAAETDAEGEAESTPAEPEPDGDEPMGEGDSGSQPESQPEPIDESASEEPPPGVDGDSGEVVDAAAAQEAGIPADGTEDGDEDEEYVPIPCDECGEMIEVEEIAELSVIRYKKPLCPVHFAGQKKKK